MPQAVLRVEGLPDAPLDAAAAFHATSLSAARATLMKAEALVLVFPSAGHEHRAWRLAAVQELAREAAPKRVNGIVGEGGEPVEEALAFLEASSGVTGQLLGVDGKSGQSR